MDRFNDAQCIPFNASIDAYHHKLMLDAVSHRQVGSLCHVGRCSGYTLDLVALVAANQSAQ